MKHLRLVTVPAIIIVLLLTCGLLHAAPPKLSFYGFDAAYTVFVAPAGIQLGWKIEGMDPATRVHIDLYQNGSFKRTLASNLSAPSYADMGGGETFWYGSYKWQTVNADIGCAYTIKIATMDNAYSITTIPFTIFFNPFVMTEYAHSVKVESPTENQTLRLNGGHIIKWSCYCTKDTFPEGKMDVELMVDNGGTLTPVGLIKTIPLNFNACNLWGQASWKVGEIASVYNAGLLPTGDDGRKYRIRVGYGNNRNVSGAFTILPPLHAVHIDMAGIAPIRPKNVSAVATGPGTIKVHWQIDIHDAGSRDITEYKIEVKTGNASFTPLATVPQQGGNIMSPHFYIHAGVTPQTYRYRVRSANATALSGWSNEALIVIPAPAHPERQTLKPQLNPNLKIK